MPKSSISAAKRVKEYPNHGFEVKNGIFWCGYCEEEVDFNKKSTIENHVKSSKHSKKKASLDHALIKQPKILVVGESQHRWTRMVTAFTSAGVPLNVFNQDSQIREWMIQNVKGGESLPSVTSLRRLLVDSGRHDFDESVNFLKDKLIVVIADESIDIKNRKKLNILAKPLEPGLLFRLISSKTIQECNAINVAKQIDLVLNDHLVQKDNLICLVSDSAPYMILAGEKLKSLSENMFHSTCWAHILHLVSEELRSGMKDADSFIASMKAALTKSPARRTLLLQALKDNGRPEKLPPVPVLTRWTTWVGAADYYWQNFCAVCKFIQMSNPDSAAMKNLKGMLENQQMALELERLSSIYQGLKSSILDLENDQIAASSVWLNIKATEELLKCCGLESEKLKLHFYKKHPAAKFWEEVQALDPRKAKDFFQNNKIPDTLLKFSKTEIPLEEILKYKLLAESNSFSGGKRSAFEFWTSYRQEMPHLSSLALTALSVPASSASVERSFSHLKRIFTATRSSLTDENLETHLKIVYNKNAARLSRDADTDTEEDNDE